MNIVFESIFGRHGKYSLKKIEVYWNLIGSEGISVFLAHANAQSLKMLTKKEKILIQPFIEQNYKKHRRKVRWLMSSSSFFSFSNFL